MHECPIELAVLIMKDKQILAPPWHANLSW